jgi:hypothetical protein
VEDVRWLAITIALLGSAGATSAAPARSGEFKEIRRTSRVAYYASQKKVAVDVERTERFLDRLAALFGPPPEGWRLQYYRHDSPRLLHADLGAAAYGLTDLDAVRIDSVLAYHPHELVHAVAGRLGRPPLLFAEGLAVALTSEGSWRGREVDGAAREAMTASRSLEPFLSRFTEQDVDTAYAVAGSFVGYLLDVYGVDAFVTFMGGCEEHGLFEAAFQRAFGRTVTRASREWQRALRAPSRAARDWYDPGSWPRSLRRSPLTPPREAGPKPAAVAASAPGAVAAGAAALLERPSAR